MNNVPASYEKPAIIAKEVEVGAPSPPAVIPFVVIVVVDVAVFIVDGVQFRKTRSMVPSLVRIKGPGLKVLGPAGAAAG